MFTFIHAADIHLDSPMLGLSQHDEAPVETIRGATRTALTRLVDLAIEREVNFILIAGDLYDGDWKDFRTGQVFVNEMRRLKAEQIPAYLIYGNHDAESQVTKDLILPDNVRVFPTNAPATVQHLDLPVSVHGQGFATRHVKDNLAANYPTPVENHFNIGLLHTNVGEREGYGDYAPSSLAQLVAHGYDYWALGHIHLRETLHKHPHVVYSGNTQGRSVRETDEKGCYVVSVNDELKVSGNEFVALDSVRWKNAQVDCSVMDSDHDLLQAIRTELTQSLDTSEGRLLAIRLTLTGHTKLHELFHSAHARLRAECQSIALDLDAEMLWIEDLRLKTQTLIDPAELANQDTLTALVLAALDNFDPTELPLPVQTLLNKLPEDARKALKSSLQPEETLDKESMRNDISAIVLQAIATSGPTQ